MVEVRRSFLAVHMNFDQIFNFLFGQCDQFSFADTFWSYWEVDVFRIRCHFFENCNSFLVVIF